MKLPITNYQLPIIRQQLMNFVVLGLVVFLLFFSSNSFAQSMRSTSFDDRPACQESKGVWRQFGNGCVDECRPKLDQFYICTDAITNGCDCGKGRCWNGDLCISMKSYKEIFAKEQAAEQKVLNAAKEERKAAAKANQEAIMEKLANDAKARAEASSQQADSKTGAAPAPNNNLSEFYNDKNSTDSASNNAAPTQPVTIIQPQQVVQQPTAPAKAEEKLPPILMPNVDVPFDPSLIPPAFLQQEKAKQKTDSTQAQNQGQDQGQNQSNTPGATPVKLPEIPLPN